MISQQLVADLIVLWNIGWCAAVAWVVIRAYLQDFRTASSESDEDDPNDPWGV